MAEATTQPSADEVHLLNERNRGAEARQLLEHHLFTAAVSAVRDRTMLKLTNAEPNDDRLRLAMQVKLQALGEIVKELRQHVENGKLAEKRWDQLKANLSRSFRRIA